MTGRAVTAAAVALVVAPVAFAAAERPTITAQTTVVSNTTPLILTGTIPGGAGERVEIEAKDCRSTFFRLVGAAPTGTGGNWTYQGGIMANTTFRATWKNAVSNEVEVKQRIFVSLVRRSPRALVATVVTSHQRMIGRTVRLERFTADGGWRLLQRAKLRRLAGPTTEARFLVRRKGMQLRAVIDTANAQPCHVAGISTILRS
ncbi:MAG TPA: hypothetical protein VE444_05220 [Gaiellaceae bacterium]|jgi:hypothetical protein|nr:hypothetical protein [Gaiellaceae bacterium]